MKDRFFLDQHPMIVWGVWQDLGLSCSERVIFDKCSHPLNSATCQANASSASTGEFRKYPI